ncbi:MAG: DUF2252 domain-containing protein [Aquabacterium sp.]|uniref:DUF2252 domain-containing protein n=1 Tax=Aquabacterium sp. TaxID=1872578 RepID=UPI001211A323|nr:DUF2252 family protein [Aquabacterium sp.]TAK91917.1 MAG: DUF2252 domain-containing protein [Aquabacterium sp.]
MNVVKSIAVFNEGRDPERLQMKYSKMRSTPFAFLRGTCHLFYEQLPLSGIFKKAPLVWTCGDLHLENFGTYKGDNRLTYFDVNDFDEALLAPASWDIVRMLTSLHVGADSLGIKRKEAQELSQLFVNGYGQALAQGKAYWLERQTAHSLIKGLLNSLQDRQRLDFLDNRTRMKNKRRSILIDGRRALPALSSERSDVIQLMNEFAQPSFFNVLDVARRIAGTGSLGVERYAILVEGKGSPNGNYLLDLKEARASSLAARVKVKQPQWATEAHRIVEIQRRFQAVPMAFLQAVDMKGKPYVLRGLQPSEDRITLDGSGHALADIQQLICDMGRLVAWGQLRSSGRQGAASADELIDFALGVRWQEKLIEASKACADQVMSDARTFSEAYDDGAFR